MTAVGPRIYHQTIHRVAEEYPLIGMALLRHRNARGQPMSFRDAPYLVEWYADFTSSSDACDGADIVSIPQCGKTEFTTQLQLHEAGWLGRLTAYAQSTADARDRLVKNRLNPLLIEVPEYRRRLPARDVAALQRGETSTDTGSMRSKRFGTGTMLFLSANTDTDWVDYSVDTMIIDEYDLCMEKSRLNIAKAKDRLRASPRPRLFRMGNPEVPRAGIELLWNEGDQRLYHWRCQHCGTRQPITWLESVVTVDDSGQYILRDPEARADKSRPVRPVCRQCHRPFEREVDGSAWIPLAPSRARRSYRVSRYDMLSVPLRLAWTEWLEAQSSTELTRIWWRGWEGTAWEPSSGGISRDDLASGAVLPPMDWKGGPAYAGSRTITAGIDVGSLFHITVSEAVRGAGGRIERRVIWLGTVKTSEQVHEVLQRYNVRTAVIDAMPETRTSQSIRDVARAKYGTDVWLCWFASTDRVGAEEFGLKTEPRARKVTVDRTQLLDAAADHIRLGARSGRMYRDLSLSPPPFLPTNVDPAQHAATWLRLSELPDVGAERARLWPADVMSIDWFIAQMMAPRRVFDENGSVRWDEAGRPDHARFSDAYDLLAYVLDQRGARVI